MSTEDDGYRAVVCRFEVPLVIVKKSDFVRRLTECMC